MQVEHPVQQSPPHISCAMIPTTTLGCTAFQSASPALQVKLRIFVSTPNPLRQSVSQTLILGSQLRTLCNALTLSGLIFMANT